MRRDGFNESLWQQNIPEYKPEPFKPDETIYDVIIVGGGITGVVTAYQLQKSGLRCLIAEAQNLCFGTTGGTTAHLNNFFDKSYDEVESAFGKTGAATLAEAANQALAQIKKNIQDLKLDCDYEEGPGFLYALNKKQAESLDKLFTASKNAGIDVQQETKIPVPIRFKKAISFAGQGQFHPAKYVYGVAKAFETGGGKIMTSCFVQDVKQGEILNVETSRGNLKSKKLIYATHIPPGVNILHLRSAPYRSYAMAVTLSNRQYPVHPAYDMQDPYHYYRTQEIDGRKYLVAGGEDHKTGHEKKTEAPFKRLESYLRKFFKVKSIAFKWSSQYYDPADGLAYIGHLPGNGENMYVATGFGGNGMTYSHITAEVLTRLITTGKESYNNIFNPGRIKPVAGFSSFVKENADVVSSFVSDRLNISTMPYLSKMRKGSAKVIKHDHQSLAVYKDDNGDTFALNPVCTHLKCIVQWNETEKSWDCPCHGARYSIGGEVLTAPSTKGLRIVDN
jgi:glycine/D-amino acid oxidase-like deaminating enzyme/nitrite reductase/ring-hydroxylating ferredoxin subunit